MSDETKDSRASGNAALAGLPQKLEPWFPDFAERVCTEVTSRNGRGGETVDFRACQTGSLRPLTVGGKLEFPLPQKCPLGVETALCHKTRTGGLEQKDRGSASSIIRMEDEGSREHSFPLFRNAVPGQLLVGS